MSLTQAFLKRRTRFDHCFLLCVCLCGWLRLSRCCIVIIRQRNYVYVKIEGEKSILVEKIKWETFGKSPAR